MTTQDKPAVGPLSAETPVSKTHPMMQAWTQYSGGPEYENSARWAIQPEHTKGSMWAAFCAGWSAGTRLAPTAPVEAGGSEPVEVTIFCPKCATPHVDEGEWATTRHHKTHQCQSCGHEWRPFPFATVGVPHPALRPQPSGETREAVARVEAMLPAIERIFPVHVTETPDYAELAFHECAAQAMTMEPDTWTALNTLATDLRALLLPAEQGGGDDLRATCQAILDDHQTSETHHPDHILIRRADFERIAALIRPAIPASEGGRG